VLQDHRRVRLRLVHNAEPCIRWTSGIDVRGVDSLEAYAQRFVATALRRVPPSDAREVYVVSLLVYDEDDDPYRPTVMVGFNTEAAVQREIDRAPDADEARWNYAYWLQNDLGILGDSGSDPHGASLRDQWIREHRLEPDRDGPRDVTRAFVDLLERVVRSLHRSDDIVGVFGRSVPVLIHELEYYTEIAQQNQRANPEGLADQFAGWIFGMDE
jgi:hypothetical protein